jgi:hypothetical protein
MAAHDDIRDHMPVLAGLVDTLDALDARQAGTVDVLLEQLLAKLNRPGGPKISSRAIV